MTINVKPSRNQKDCFHQYLQKLVLVDYQVQNPVPVVPLHMFTIKSVYHEHLLKVKVTQVSTYTRYIFILNINSRYNIDCYNVFLYRSYFV